MRARAVPILALAAALAALGSAFAASTPYGQLPVAFEANRGQADPRVRFLVRQPGAILFLTADEAVLRLASLQPAELRWRPLGTGEPVIEGLDRLPGVTHYFAGSDPARWKTDVPSFARVRYRGVYPGIDLVYHGNEGRIEYDFDLAPGAAPERIRLGFSGAEALVVDVAGGGDLVATVAGRPLRFARPVAYQEIGGTRREVAVAYRLMAGGRPPEVGFALGAYDHGRPLVIDPLLPLPPRP